jgi:glycosyltransferase involved in cell wall biosynthesis
MSKFAPRVAIITPTIGTDHLQTNIDSVRDQSYENIIHYVVADGPKYHDKVKDIAYVSKTFLNRSPTREVFCLPQKKRSFVSS